MVNTVAGFEKHRKMKAWEVQLGEVEWAVQTLQD